MTRKTGQSSGNATAPREDRLKAALKANLARRKAQAKARKPGTSNDNVQSSDKE